MKVLLVCLMIVCLSWAKSTRGTKSTRASLSCNCGWRNAGRIVGGKETRKNEYPWMVSLSNGCGGSIITPWHVLTAAHCTDGESASSISISVGRHYKYGQNQNLKTHRVARIIQHEAYDENDDNPLNDVSVLVLATPITFTQYVGPVCMPNKQLNLLGKFIKITGWGLTKGTGDQNVLREVDVEVISNSVCRRSWPRLHKRVNQLCAYTVKKDSCNGDSGGPLVYLDPETNRYTQVALVSYGPVACGTDPRPSVNTDVFAFNSWIQQAIAKSRPDARVCTKV
ncbi:venom serine protease 34 [Halyomorpha halys]|uniref:venom serine protease 34 n=1 Tax=Halyomorpha halys TaxID=286706 RepID=UPI0006D50911|nr:venom serine protease 34-like [Halyomorpha halys]